MAAAAAVGKRVAFLQDEHSQRRLVVVLAEGEEALPPGRPKQPRSSSSSPALVVDKLAAVLQRALRIDQSTAAFYVQQAGCDVRAAIEKVRRAAGPAGAAGCTVPSQQAAPSPEPPPTAAPPVLLQYEEDKRWEKVMQRRGSRLQR